MSKARVNYKVKIKIVIIVLVMFALQFVIVPLVFPRYFPSSSEAGWFLLLSFAAFSLGEILWVSDRMGDWLLGDVLYFLLILFFNRGAYGIGWTGIALDGIIPRYDPSAVPLHVAIDAIIMLVIQFSLWGVIKVARRLRARPSSLVL